jgi:tRNAThr (cytosine32-N3)-methyltransferase
MDRAGDNAWRHALYARQSERARELLRIAGVPDPAADAVATWVAKSGLHRNPGTQALEDAACMVFLEHEIEHFAARHADYSHEKMVHILRRIWRKMSPEARAAATTLAMPKALRAMLDEAATG